MKYLILGGSGLLGSCLVRSLSVDNEVHYTYFNNEITIRGGTGSKIDLKDTESVADLISSISPNCVIHTAAQPSVDWHERERMAAYQTNVIGTKIIAQKTRTIGAKLIYISTAFVFPDIPAKIFDEEDIPAPINFYGVTKFGAEIATKTNPNHLIIRTDQIYGWSQVGQKKSFVVNTLEKLKNGEKVEVCRDWSNSPTYVVDLADAIIRLLELDRTGIFHAVGNSFLNRYDWGVKIAEFYGMDPSLIVGIESSKLNLPAMRPNSRISNEKLMHETGMIMKNVDEGMKAMGETNGWNAPRS